MNVDETYDLLLELELGTRATETPNPDGVEALADAYSEAGAAEAGGAELAPPQPMRPSRASGAGPLDWLATAPQRWSGRGAWPALRRVHSWVGWAATSRWPRRSPTSSAPRLKPRPWPTPSTRRPPTRESAGTDRAPVRRPRWPTWSVR